MAATKTNGFWQVMAAIAMGLILEIVNAQQPVAAPAAAPVAQPAAAPVAPAPAPAPAPTAAQSLVPTMAPSIDVVVIYNNLSQLDIGLICSTVILFVLLICTCYMYCRLPAPVAKGYSQV